MIEPQKIFQILIGRSNSDEAESIIVLQTRLPKAITSLLVGMALPIAGLFMQTFFRNPVAGPDILGISAGAGLFVSIVMLSAGSIFAINKLDSISILIASILGATVMLILLLAVSYKLKDSVSLLLFGIMLGMAVSAVVGILQYYSEQGALKLFILWSFGSLGAVTNEQLRFLIPIILAGVFTSFLLAKNLNLLLLGEKYAQSLGLNIRNNKLIIIFLTALFTGSITAFCGPIAFVGLAVPHLARMIFKTNNHFILIPACLFCGAILMLCCDIISQTPGSGGVLPINSITSFLGAPFVIYILWKNQKLRQYF